MFNLFTDGGSRGNPGKAACAFYLFDENKELIDKGGQFLHIATNNVAEYSGLILGLTHAKTHGVKELQCNLDSELIVKQLNGLYKVKHPAMKPLYDQVIELKQVFMKITFVHIPREQNSFADALVNEVLDAQ